MTEAEDKWKAKHVKAIIDVIDSQVISDREEELGKIIDRIYADGFEDGQSEAPDEDSVREDMAAQIEFQRESRD